jgi:hypothetical protein
MAKYITSKLVEVSKLAKTSGLGNLFRMLAFDIDARFKWLGERYEAQSKNDGCCGLAFLGVDHMYALSRTGEQVMSMDMQLDILHMDFADVIAKLGDLVLITEAWWPGKGEFNTISGAFRKQSEQRPRLKFIVHDILTKKEYDAGKADTPYRLRMDRGLGVRPKTAAWQWTTRHAPGSYGDPRDLCASYVGSGGYDGVVLVDLEAGWVLDDGKDGQKVKVKNELSFDLRVVEVITAIGEKTGRPVYKIVVDFKGKLLGVGSGIPHDLAKVPQVGDIVEVCAMDYSSDGLLREPRYKGIRHDKLEPDT